ncbi:helix-turn-helix domain-containing protein [Furfurilactobacillus rossiae]|nr:helix-turn-helix domain-containing protein [Furfurilactobacillus milii]MYV17728.1 helix-turn-helix domain-containing protein [Furfurilactobacillus milii]QFR67563.1 helix-turn-helix domain-containing protein [Furfurilactobacillus rossiae]
MPSQFGMGRFGGTEMKKSYDLDEYVAGQLKDPEFKREYDKADREIVAALAVKNLREEMGISQRELAQVSGTAQSTIVRIENGNLDLKLSTLQKIAQSVGKELEIRLV